MIEMDTDNSDKALTPPNTVEAVYIKSLGFILQYQRKSIQLLIYIDSLNF